MPKKKSVEVVINSSISSEQRAALIHRCKTDLYWLCREVLGYKDMVQHVHGPICETYIKKDPSKGVFEQSQTKSRMVLAPRGTFKTCIDIGDIVQWILCFPNIRILLLTGKQTLAWRMVREVKQHFQNNETLRELFPEYCPKVEVGKKWGTDDEFTTPARTEYRREPTLSSSTIESVNSGPHFEVIKPDDVVNDVNATTPDQCLKVIEAFDSLHYMLEPGGYTEINGTRYSGLDLYGRLIEREAGARRDWYEDPDNVGDYVPDFQFTILSAWKLKADRQVVKDESGRLVLRKDDVELLFPERLKFRDLYKTYRKDPDGFACQMLNDPDQVVGEERPFTEALLSRHTIPFNNMPHPSACNEFIMWDLAGSNHERASNDFSVGVVGRLDMKGSLFVVDMVRGKWNAAQMAAQIVTLQKNYPTAQFTWIEDSQGSRLLEPAIMSVANQCGVTIRLSFVKIPRFGGAKRYRIDALAQCFRVDKLWLAAYLPYIDVLKTELLDRNPPHDDCSDALALLAKELNVAATAASVDIPKPSRKEIADRLFEAALYGDDSDAIAESYTPTNEAEQPQEYKAGILGYGFCP